jgi:hypothetical protein
MLMTKITYVVINDKKAHILVLHQHGHQIPVCALLLLQALRCAPLYQGWHAFEKDVLVCAEDAAWILPEGSIAYTHVEKRGIRAQLRHTRLYDRFSCDTVRTPAGSAGILRPGEQHKHLTASLCQFCHFASECIITFHRMRGRHLRNDSCRSESSNISLVVLDY